MNAARKQGRRRRKDLSAAKSVNKPGGEFDEVHLHRILDRGERQPIRLEVKGGYTKPRRRSCSHSMANHGVVNTPSSFSMALTSAGLTQRQLLISS